MEEKLHVRNEWPCVNGKVMWEEEFKEMEGELYV